MELQKQKTLFLNKIENDDSLSIDLKEQLEKQVSAMDDDEFTVFLESMKGIKNEKELNEKISQTQEMEKAGHAKFLQIVGKLSRNITRNKSENQETSDKSKADELLKKINSL